MARAPPWVLFLAVPLGPHDRITRQAARQAGWPRWGIRLLVVAVRRPDLREFGWRPRRRRWLRIDATDAYRPRHHADRVPPARHGEAWLAAARYVEAQRQAALAAPDGAEAVAALGRALHAAQDVFSHSNHVDLDEASREAAVQALLSCSPPPPALRLTAFAPGAARPGAPDDPFPHALFAKDAPAHNAAALQEKGGRTAYDAAQDTAIEVSRHMIEAFLASWPGTRRSLAAPRRWPWLVLAAVAAVAAWRAER